MTDIQQLASTDDHVIMTAEFAIPPQQLFDYWIDPDKITLWWAEKAEINAHPGGEYCLQWLTNNWELYGTYGRVEHGRLIEFSWHWRHQAEKPVRQVTVEFESLADGGTHLHLTHGIYAPADAEERQSHIDGWLYFLRRLQNLMNGDT